jgi:hypothetical protein
LLPLSLALLLVDVDVDVLIAVALTGDEDAMLEISIGGTSHVVPADVAAAQANEA